MKIRGYEWIQSRYTMFIYLLQWPQYGIDAAIYGDGSKPDEKYYYEVRTTKDARVIQKSKPVFASPEDAAEDFEDWMSTWR